MFICRKCLNCVEKLHSGSFGPCEVCGKTREGVDCPPWHEWKAAPPLKKRGPDKPALLRGAKLKTERRAR